MTTVQSPLTPPARRSMAPAGPKLRDSCNRCAASKLKCSKEKPTCARCAKRGMVCEYFATKRAGRKQGSRPPVTQDLPKTASSWTTAICDPEILASPGVMQLSPRSPPVGYPDIFSGASLLADPTASTPSSLNFHADDFPAPPISFSMLELPDAGDLTDSCQFNDQNHMSNLSDLGSATPLLASNNVSSSMETAAVPGFRPSSSSAPPPEPLDGRRSSMINGLHSGPICSLLVRALGLLKQLPSPASASCHASKGQGLENHHGLDRPPTIQSVIADNEQTVQAIGDILQCQCSQDGYLLAILSVIIFKVLGRYAAVVRQTPALDGDGQCWDTTRSDHQAQQHPEHGQRPPAVVVVVGDYSADGEDQGRMAAQQILSQLHRVQRLVNILSRRFKPHGGRAEPPSSSSCSIDGSDVLSYTESLFPFPDSMLEQMEVDLRKRLRNLSAEIVDILRSG